MALQNCPECSGHVSTKAAKCPHCGYPVNPAKSDVGVFRVGVLKRAYLVLTVLMFVGLIGFAFTNNYEWLAPTLICFLGAMISAYKVYLVKKHGNDINNRR